jgi:hypothetical protein
MREILRGWTPRKVFTFGLGILMGAMVASCPAEAQVVRYGYLADDLARQLESEWTPTLNQAERMYCILRDTTVRLDNGDEMVMVVDAPAADLSRANATLTGINGLVRCPGVSRPVAFIHTHPGHDDCGVSRIDYQSLIASGRKYDVIQCGARHFRFVWADEARLRIDGPGAAGKPRWRIPLGWVIGAVGAPLVYNAACAPGMAYCSRDPGGYPDTWHTEDKPIHALSASAITYSCAALSGRSRTCALLTVAAGALYEVTQGYVSKKDIAANTLGAGVALLTLELGR